MERKPVCKGWFDTFSQKRIEQIEAKCKDESFCRSGMLGKKEKLQKVCQRDMDTLTEMKITWKQIYQRLNSIIGKWRSLRFLIGMQKLPKGTLVEGRYQIEEIVHRGSQECPFKDPNDHYYYGYDYGDRYYTIFDTKTGEELQLGSLLLHMISVHGFFEGDNPYRVDPRKVIEMFDIKSGVDYKVKSKKEIIWRAFMFELKDRPQNQAKVLEAIPNQPAFSYYRRAIQKRTNQGEKTKKNKKNEDESSDDDYDSGYDSEDLEVKDLSLEQQEIVLVFDKNKLAQEHGPLEVDLFGYKLLFSQYLTDSYFPGISVLFRLGQLSCTLNPEQPQV